MQETLWRRACIPLAACATTQNCYSDTQHRRNTSNMTSKRFLQAIPLTAIAVCMAATNGFASTITYSTNGSGTQFVSPITGLSLVSSSGLAATLSFQPDMNLAIGAPSNINYGLFTLVCSTCLTDHTDSAVFAAFTFDLVIAD